MSSRKNALNKWLLEILNTPSFTIRPLTGDASFRRYFRLSCEGKTYIVMDAPPDKEAIAPFIKVDEILSSAKVRTPKIHAADIIQGFIMLDDFGDILLLKGISTQNQDALYLEAIRTLVQIQQCPTYAIPAFDKSHMLKEIGLFQEWFLQAYLNLTLRPSEQIMLNEIFDWLTEKLSQQPQVFIHRDYHSRNLMIINIPKLGVIDFQDAMRGPITYDLVSLLKDCYIKLPDAAYYDYAGAFYQRQPLVQGWTLPEFIDEMDYCGLQRHLKVLGIFCRLYLRDNKSGYLNDLPLTLDYTMTCLKRHTTLQPLLQFMSTRVVPRFMEKTKP